MFVESIFEIKNENGINSDRSDHSGYTDVCCFYGSRSAYEHR